MSHLSGALADSTAPPATRTRLVADVFGGEFSKTTVSLLTSVAAQRWSRAADLVAAIEETAVRAAAIAEPGADIEGELFARLADRRRATRSSSSRSAAASATPPRRARSPRSSSTGG